MVQDDVLTNAGRRLAPNNPTNNSKLLYHAANDEQMYDDACDLGQFFINPCLFLFTQIEKRLSRRSKQHSSSHDSSHALCQDKAKKKTSHLTMQFQQTFYLISIFGSWCVIFQKFYPLASAHIPVYHLRLGYLVFVSCVSSWRLVASTSPGVITSQSIDRFDNYQYDDLLYVKDTLCPTMGFRKLSRSKYDRYTDQHIARFDHYCGWISTAIGEENYRHFLLFLLVHVIMCVYGSIMLFVVLCAESKINLLTEVAISWLQVDYWLNGVLCLMTIMGALLLTYFSFHLYLVSEGMTTNEFFKWKLVKGRHLEALSKYNRSAGDEEGGTSQHHPGSMPSNVYNLGYSANCLEVLHPRSLYKEGRHKDA